MRRWLGVCAMLLMAVAGASHSRAQSGAEHFFKYPYEGDAAIGGGTFIEAKRPEELDFLQFDFTSLKRAFGLRRVLVTNLNASPGLQGPVPDSDGDGLSDEEETRLGLTSFVKADTAATHERMKHKVNEELKRSFRPEFLNRIDDIIVFHELSTDDITKMVDMMIKRLKGQLESQGLGLELTMEAKVLLAKQGYDPQLGARPLRRAIQRLIEDPLSEKILWKEFTAGEAVLVDAENDEIVFRSLERLIDEPVAEAASTATPEA